LQRLDRGAAIAKPVHQTPQLRSHEDAKKESIDGACIVVGASVEEAPSERRETLPLIIQGDENQKEEPLSASPELYRPVPASSVQTSPADSTRHEESIVRKYRQSAYAPSTEECKEKLDGTEDAQDIQDGSRQAREAGFGIAANHDADAASAGAPQTAEAGTFPTPEDLAPDIQGLEVVSGESGASSVADQPKDRSDTCDGGVSSAIIGGETAKTQKTAQEKKPRKYQGLTRGVRQSAESKSQKQRQDGEETASRDRSLSIAVRLRFDRDGFCTVSLIGKRRDGLPEEITVATRSGELTLEAMQDEWYQDVMPDDISQVLHDGTVWKQNGLDGQFIWSISGRQIFVLAARDDISGYVSQPCLDLGRRHAVLCSEKIKDHVSEAIRATGAEATAVLDQSMGTPPGWVVFRDVIPSKPVPLATEADALNALRPIPQIEISLEAGIRLDHANWLEGHPPVIRIYGNPEHTADVRIDGNPATCGDDGAYRLSGWDSVGSHSVWCAGTNKSYAIIPFSSSWERWDAYTFAVYYGSAKSISICGPLVQAPNAQGQGQVASVVVPETNPILLGSAPGEYAIGERVSDVRATPLVAAPPFRTVWALPRDPLHCDKAAVRILLMSNEVPIEQSADSMSGAKAPSRQELFAWCGLILDASRKGLRTEPDTESARALWLAYKRMAHQIRRARR
jgi:hypothetical protein